MRTELFALFLSIVLGLLHLLATAAAATKQRGTRWNLSSRDGTPQPLTGLAGRWDRSFQNFKETFPFFLGAICLVVFADKTGPLSSLGAWTYWFARMIYIPCYVLNITVVRSFIWLLSFLGIASILVQTLI